MPRKLYLYILSFFMCIGAVITDSQAKSAPEVQQQDFGKDFAMLFQMGLPRLDGAQPASIFIEYKPIETHRYSVFNFGVGRFFGWVKVPKKNNEPATCVFYGIFKCKLYNSSDIMAMLKNSVAKPSGQETWVTPTEYPEYVYFSGDWQIISTAKIAAYSKLSLPRETSEHSLQKIPPSDALHEGLQNYGLRLLLAAQLYDSGAKSEANEIATCLFKRGGYKEVLQAAINVLADAKYLRAYCDLIESNDWKQFNADLKRIIATFQNKWEGTRHVKTIQAVVAARIKNTEPPELKTKFPLSKEESKLIAQLSQMKQADYDISRGYGGSWLNSEYFYNRHYTDYDRFGGCWLFPVDKKNEVDANKTDAVNMIKRGGIKSIPLLLAMLDDEYFLSFRESSNHSRYPYHNPMEDDTETKPQTSMEEACQYLITPMTRGQLAKELLAPLIIPKNRDDYAVSEKNDEFKKQCLDWYESIKSLNIKDLQIKYLSDGAKSQRLAALKDMIAVADDTTAPLIEKAILEDIKIEETLTEFDQMHNLDLIFRYCEIRKDKAKQFIEKLQTKCYQHLTKDYHMQGRRINISKEKIKVELNTFFDQLKQSKSNIPIEDVIKALSAQTDEDDFVFVKLKFARAAKKQPIEKIHQICLDAAISSNNPKQKLFLLDLLRMQCEGRRESNLDVARFKIQLEKLLTESSIFPEEFSVRHMVPLIVASMIEATVEGTQGTLKNGIGANMRELYKGPYGRWEDKYVQHRIRRAKAILAGTSMDKLPELITADKLQDAQISKAKAWLDGKSAHEIITICGQAQLNELIPLSLALDKDKQLNSKLLPLANLIIEADTDISEVKDQIARFKGQELTKQILQEILKLAENCMRNGLNVKASLIRSSALQGVVVKFKRLETDTINLNMDADVMSATIRRLRANNELWVHFSFGGPSGNGMSRTVALKNVDHSLTENNKNDLDDQGEQERKFMEAFSNSFLKVGNALWAGKILINCGE